MKENYAGTNIAAVAEYYRVKDAGARWELRCNWPGCKAAWAYPKDAQGSGPLHLLEHALSHREPPPDEDRP